VDVPDYVLPPEAIAQEPTEPRDAARLLDAIDPGGATLHRRVRDLPERLGPGDLLVVNTTRVLPARLLLHKATGGAAEVLLVSPSGPVPTGVPPAGNAAAEGETWTAMVRPGRRLPPGTRLLHDGRTVVEVGEHLDDGLRQVRLLNDGVPADQLLASVGVLPLPPYIEAAPADPERYQTVYARRPASLAAPTAGLHFTEGLLARCAARGAGLATVDLEVGLATFSPVRAERVEDHVMHRERYRVPEETMAACDAARRVIAVGTTTVRALESAAATGALSGETALYIHGRYRFGVVDVLLTNFHQPRSSLLVLLEAFCGPRWRALYAEALAVGYRFLSFGDAMVVGRT